jgi:protein-ribulosamine 3-kinase
MHTDAIITHAIREAGICGPLARVQAISSDAHQSVLSIELENARRFIAKVVGNDQRERLTAEQNGLRALSQSATLHVPTTQPIVDADGHSVLIMACLETAQAAREEAWARFGDELAQHHLSHHGDAFGWEIDNFIGATPQINTRCDDWVEFNAVHRLGYQLRLARDRGLVPGSESSQVTGVIDRLDRLIPRRPHPALLHGDLWSGNVIPTPIGSETRISLIDPAVYVGDGWADIAMFRLFGSPPHAFERAYAEINADHDQLSTRILVYQLYHMLNHLNLFGTSYLGSVLRICDRLR